MEDFRVVYIWAKALLVLFYGCWFAEAKTPGKITLYWSQLLEKKWYKVINILLVDHFEIKVYNYFIISSDFLHFEHF